MMRLALYASLLAYIALVVSVPVAERHQIDDIQLLPTLTKDVDSILATATSDVFTLIDYNEKRQMLSSILKGATTALRPVTSELAPPVVSQAVRTGSSLTKSLASETKSITKAVASVTSQLRPVTTQLRSITKGVLSVTKVPIIRTITSEMLPPIVTQGVSRVSSLTKSLGSVTKSVAPITNTKTLKSEIGSLTKALLPPVMTAIVKRGLIGDAESVLNKATSDLLPTATKAIDSVLGEATPAAQVTQDL